MAFRIAPLNPMPAELPGAIYEDAQARAEDNHLLQLAQLERLDRAQREQAQYNNARLQLDQDRQERFQGGVAGGQAYVFDPRTGEYKWSAVPSSTTMTAPRAFQHGVAGNQAYVFDPNTGEYKWSAVPGMTDQALPDGGWNTGGGGGGGSRAGGGSSVQRSMPYGGVVGTGGIRWPGLPDGGSSYQRDVQTSPPVLTPEASQGFAVGGPVPNMFRGHPSTPNVTMPNGMAGAAFPEGFDPGKWLGTSAAMTTPAAGPRVLDVATAKMYLMRAGGDRARAQALAAADGY
jgi:hypothetical protein